jgi:uncharacterized protein (DUF2267 family)
MLMKYEEFLGKVRNRARLSSSEQAEAAVEATFETLAERLKGNEVQHLARGDWQLSANDR